MIEVNGKKYRNIQEQVAKNQEDIAALDDRLEIVEETTVDNYTKTEIDEKDAATLQSAKDYADGKDADTLASAEAYARDIVSDIPAAYSHNIVIRGVIPFLMGDETTTKYHTYCLSCTLWSNYSEALTLTEFLNYVQYKGSIAASGTFNGSALNCVVKIGYDETAQAVTIYYAQFASASYISSANIPTIKNTETVVSGRADYLVIENDVTYTSYEDTPILVGDITPNE